MALPQGWIHHDWSDVVPPPHNFNHPQIHPPDGVKIRPPFAPKSTPPVASAPRPALYLSRPVSSHGSSRSGSGVDGFAGAAFLPSSDSTLVESPPSKNGGLPDEALGLDRFAPVFVLKWLKELPPPFKVLTMPRPPHFPPTEYASSLIRHPPLRLTPAAVSLLAVGPPQPSEVRVLDLNASHPNLDAHQYAEHFTKLLALYLLGDMEIARSAIVYRAHVHPYAPGVYRIQVPGIREDVPRLVVGDRVVMRGLYPDMQAPITVAVDADVTGLVKKSGWVYVRSPHIDAVHASLPRDSSGAAEYQIRFKVSAGPACRMQDAVRIMDLATAGGNDTARRWLFPDQQPTEVARTDMGVEWIDQDINAEQQGAVRDILFKAHRIPYLISGPPGTGKTKTLVEAILQILNIDSSASVLVSAPSSTAADTVAQRLSRVLDHSTMFRLNSPHRGFAEVPDSLMPYCHIVDNQFALPAYADLMRFRVVVCGMQDAGILLSARATNADIQRAEHDLHRAFHPLQPADVKLHWTHLIVDEAAQASEPETLIPLSVVLPLNSDVEPTIVLCGDTRQLGPVIASLDAREGGLDVSLLERLFERGAYRKRDCAHLLKNYRSTAPILMVPSAMFYNDTLEPAARVPLFSWSQLPNSQIPILFHGTESEEHWIEEGASWYNTGEIVAVVHLALSLKTERPDVKPHEIAIITPWREQVWKIRAGLRAVGLHGISVGNVETFQGGEFRVTMLSCVRTKARFLPDDRRNNMGLYNEAKRFNVAITRAKELLVVVGNANFLKGDPYWNGFLQIMLRNGLYRGPKLDISMDGAYISNIESGLKGQPKGAEEMGMYLAGEIARDALRE